LRTHHRERRDGRRAALPIPRAHGYRPTEAVGTGRNALATNLRQPGKRRGELDLREQPKCRVGNAVEMPDGGPAFVLARLEQDVAELLRGGPAFLRGIIGTLGISFPGVQPDALPEWRQIDQGVSSALIMTESLRTLDRLRLRANLADAEVAKRRATILALIASLELVDIDAIVLDRAAQPMPTELGTLDAIHLASALHFASQRARRLEFVTSDKKQRDAASELGMRTLLIE